MSQALLRRINPPQILHTHTLFMVEDIFKADYIDEEIAQAL